MTRSFVIDVVSDIDVGVYEVYPIGLCFSYIVHSEVELLPGDYIVIWFNVNCSQVVKVFRGDDYIYEFHA